MRRLGFVVLGLLITLNLCRADTTEVQSAKWKPSPGGAALRSLVYPGWGQAYNCRPLKAVIIGTVEEGLIFGILREHQLFRDARRFKDDTAASLYKDQRNRIVWMLAGWMIYASVDAFVDAHLYDFDVSDQLSCAGLEAGGIKIQFGWISR